MRSLEEIFKENYESESVNLSEWCDQIYNKYFGSCYKMMDDVRSKIVIDDNGFMYGKLSDQDIERIITELPLDLYTASESLNKLRLQFEMIKLKYKQLRRSITEEARKSVMLKFPELPVVDMKRSEIEELVQEEAYDKIAENELLIKAYESVISRAENERSSCRELIMGAKKLWDSRRSAEQSNPIGEVSENSDLPDYKDVAKNQYIR